MISSGAVIQFYDRHFNKTEAHIAMGGQRLSSISFDASRWRTQLNTLLNTICSSMHSTIRRKRHNK
ncbi:unnamed protein product [Toxocara canis]|nr:unnamed protein product [Toxocara canis]